MTAAGASLFRQTPMPEMRNGKYQDLSLWVDCRSKDLLIGNGNQVKTVWKSPGSALTLGAVRPMARVATNASGGAKSALITDFVFEGWA